MRVLVRSRKRLCLGPQVRLIWPQMAWTRPLEPLISRWRARSVVRWLAARAASLLPVGDAVTLERSPGARSNSGCIGTKRALVADNYVGKVDDLGPIAGARNNLADFPV